MNDKIITQLKELIGKFEKRIELENSLAKVKNLDKIAVNGLNKSLNKGDSKFSLMLATFNRYEAKTNYAIEDLIKKLKNKA